LLRYQPRALSGLVGEIGLAENAASVALMKRMGFHQVGTHQRYGKLNGQGMTASS
jgi:L-amino acid N-acyltransferase YncA